MNKIVKAAKFSRFCSQNASVYKVSPVVTQTRRSYYVDEAPTIGKSPDKSSPDFKTQALDIAVRGHNLLLLGAAGTGKSYAILELVKRLKENGRRVSLTCTTGIACSIYQDAMTIHKWSGIGDGRHDPSEIGSLIRHNVKYNDVRKRMMETDVLVIDECSMLSAKFFSALTEVLKTRKDNASFGGMQVIFTGDFMQLPPVPNASYSEEGDFCFKHPDFKLYFPHRVTLTEVTRQNELTLIKAISETAIGEVSEETITFIQGLNKPTDNLSTKLFSRNDQVDDYNRKAILDFPGELYEFRAKDEGDLSKLHRIQAPKILWIKEGAPVILLRNLSDKLVNGLQGRVIKISEQGPLVEFPSVSITLPLNRFPFTIFSPRENRDVATREQFPIKLSFAITIHKAQGLTMDNVEIDCSGMFKPGQLGVALGRARSSTGLCVLNFTRQCILRQPEQIRQFMEEKSRDLQDDFQCCFKQIESSIQTEASAGMYTLEDLQEIKDAEAAEGFDFTEEEEFDEEFDDAILAILENETANVQLPDDLNINKILDSIRFKDVITPAQFSTNQILDEIDPSRYRKFCQQEFAKISSFLSYLLPKLNTAQPIPISEQSEFYSKVHHYQISVEFRMNCLSLFDTAFSENHLHICYNISVAIRQYVQAKKAETYQAPSQKSCQRQVTHASHARIRYIAGYCVAKVRHKFYRQKQANMYDTSVIGQNKYKQALCAVNLLDSLKMEEQYIHEVTTMPYSLIDIERRQSTNRSLTSVSDVLFNFFLKLADKGLSLLVDKNLNEKGSNLFQFLLETVLSCEALFDQFANVVDVSEVGMSGSDETAVDDQVKKIYHKLVKHFLMVMVNQFRKDLLDSYNISKKMAHRKEIRVSTGQKGKGKLSHQPDAISKISGNVTTGKRRKRVETETRSEESRQEKTMDNSGSSANLEPEPIVEFSRQESDLMASTSKEQHTESEDSETESELICSLCNTRDKDTDWLQCDGCNNWFHRLCLGLKHHMKWKKATKKGAKFCCKACG